MTSWRSPAPRISPAETTGAGRAKRKVSRPRPAFLCDSIPTHPIARPIAGDTMTWATVTMFLMFLVAIFLILLVLVQRGRGGGLAGALGGMGGQSAFGTKAGDLFTRI